MTFSYREITPGIIRPIIPIILKVEHKFALYSALIDSGADHCIFSIEVAKLLDINTLHKKVTLSGISAQKVVGYLGSIEITIDQITYKLKAVFADIADFGHGILGQKGFFDHFDVKLSYNKQIIELESITNQN